VETALTSPTGVELDLRRFGERPDADRYIEDLRTRLGAGTHSEQAVQRTAGEQNTGNHPTPGSQQAGGADRFGGTRAGAENVEPQGKPGA